MWEYFQSTVIPVSAITLHEKWIGQAQHWLHLPVRIIYIRNLGAFFHFKLETMNYIIVEPWEACSYERWKDVHTKWFTLLLNSELVCVCVLFWMWVLHFLECSEKLCELCPPSRPQCVFVRQSIAALWQWPAVCGGQLCCSRCYCPITKTYYRTTVQTGLFCVCVIRGYCRTFAAYYAVSLYYIFYYILCSFCTVMSKTQLLILLLDWEWKMLRQEKCKYHFVFVKYRNTFKNEFQTDWQKFLQCKMTLRVNTVVCRKDPKQGIWCLVLLFISLDFQVQI